MSDKTFIIHSVYQRGCSIELKEVKIKAQNESEAVGKRRKKAPSQRILKVFEVGTAPDLRDTAYRLMGGQI